MFSLTKIVINITMLFVMLLFSHMTLCDEAIKNAEKDISLIKNSEKIASMPTERQKTGLNKDLINDKSKEKQQENIRQKTEQDSQKKQQDTDLITLSNKGGKKNIEENLENNNADIVIKHETAINGNKKKDITNIKNNKNGINTNNKNDINASKNFDKAVNKSNLPSKSNYNDNRSDELTENNKLNDDLLNNDDKLNKDNKLNSNELGDKELNNNKLNGKNNLQKANSFKENVQSENNKNVDLKKDTTKNNGEKKQFNIINDKQIKGLKSKPFDQDSQQTESERKKKFTDKIFNALDEKQSNAIPNKFFVKFDKQKALDVNYADISYDNFGFLENEEELTIIKRVLREQQDPDLRKIREENEKAKSSIVDKTRSRKPPERALHVYSLFFFNENEWCAKVNHENINDTNKKTKLILDTKIIKVNKTSIVFLMTKSNTNLIKKVNALKKEKVPYSDNYYLVKDKGKTYVAFKLFVGQKINLDTMKIYK